GLVRSSTHDRAIASPGDDHRFAAQRRIIALLDRRVEGVHIDVYYLADRHLEPILYLLHRNAIRKLRKTAVAFGRFLIWHQCCMSTLQTGRPWEALMARKDSLEEYRAKRDFHKTPEPGGGQKKKREKKLVFVIQKHDARNLHYDFRLQVD